MNGATLHDGVLLLCTVIAVVGLVFLVGWFKLNSFVALIIASLTVGLCSGLPPGQVVKTFQEGMGSVLGAITAVVGLGTILGKLLAESRGGERIALTLLSAMGRTKLPLAMMLIGFVVGIPVFFSVGLVLLAPILFSVRQESGLSILRLGVPLVAGLSVVHGLLPPHPGPIVAVEILHANAGLTIFYGLLVGLPTALVAGPVFGRYISDRVPVRAENPLANELAARTDLKVLPPFGPALFTILLPVILMMGAALADIVLEPRSPVRQIADLIGSPLIALLISLLVSFYTLGLKSGFGREKILKFSDECLGPVAVVLLVVGAGGGFNRMLVAGGVGDAIARFVSATHISPLLFGWLVAALIRVATGSATVAITTAAGIVAPLLASDPRINRELLVIAMGSGSLICSHVNDGGFWFVKQYLGLSVGQTLKSWTVLETIASLVSLLMVLLLQMLVG